MIFQRHLSSSTDTLEQICGTFGISTQPNNLTQQEIQKIAEENLENDIERWQKINIERQKRKKERESLLKPVSRIQQLL